MNRQVTMEDEINYLSKFVIILITVISISIIKAQNNTPVGYWKTINEETQEVRSIVKIWKADNGKLKGKIVKIFPGPDDDPNPVCEECEGDRKNEPILGMEFLWGFEGENKKWKNGKILDPQNGKIYNCELKVSEQGDKMEVYGYIQLLVKIGRTQIWKRVKKDEIDLNSGNAIGNK